MQSFSSASLPATGQRTLSPRVFWGPPEAGWALRVGQCVLLLVSINLIASHIHSTFFFYTLGSGVDLVAEEWERHGVLCGSSGVPKVTGPDRGLYSVGGSDCAFFWGLCHHHAGLVTSSCFRRKKGLPYRSASNLSCHFVGFRRASGRWLFVGTQGAGLCVIVYVWLKSSTPSAHYCQVLSGAGLALGEPVVPWRIWISSVKIPELLQSIF